jgi:hypothetical protein
MQILFISIKILYDEISPRNITLPEAGPIHVSNLTLFNFLLEEKLPVLLSKIAAQLSQNLN